MKEITKIQANDANDLHAHAYHRHDSDSMKLMNIVEEMRSELLGSV